MLSDRYDHAYNQQSELQKQLQTGRWTQEARESLEKQRTQWNTTATKISNTQDRLKKLCKEDHPFAHPVYWAGFVSQGVS